MVAWTCLDTRSGPRRHPVDQHHDGGQARTVTTTYTESAFLRGWKRSPARQPGQRGIGREGGCLQDWLGIADASEFAPAASFAINGRFVT
jgi:hypothetical protein